MGKKGGYTKGRDRTFHFGLPDKYIVGMISHLAAMLPVACGLGLAEQLKGTHEVTLTFVGDGATREGDFHEAINLAAVWKLPVIFVIENNGYGLSTPTGEAMAVADLAGAAEGYGLVGESVDGNNVLAVVDAVRRAVVRANEGGGPTLLEMKTFRMRGHEEASGIKYVPELLFEEWGDRDPVIRMEEHLLNQGIATPEEMEKLRAGLVDEVEEAAEYALIQPQVESNLTEETKDLFAPPFVLPQRTGGPKHEIRFIDAISEGLREAMSADERVLIMGQDIAEYGGVFKVTAGFLEQFGKDRIRNTPIIESGAIGAAMGLALGGFKPIVEMQYADFISCGFNQIVNNLATTHYRWGASVNVTIRAPYGGFIGAGPFHSQSKEAWFCHVPGLKVVIPSTPEDAKGLLMTAIEEPNPVIFFEHKHLYRSLRGEVTKDAFYLPFGVARVARVGEDATIVTYGLGVRWALEEAEHQAERGRSIEVIDLRTLLPWDRASVLASLKKTNRLLILHEASLSGGFGAEVFASIAEEGFSLLDAPPMRVGGADIPIPFSPQLEKDLFAARSRLRPAVEKLLAY